MLRVELRLHREGKHNFDIVDVNNNFFSWLPIDEINSFLHAGQKIVVPTPLRR